MSAPYSPDNPEGNPWTFLSKDDFIDNQWVNISVHQLSNISGRQHIYNVIHFKNRAVGIVPLHDDGTLTLVGQFRYPLGQYSWELPEGGCPEGEDLLDCAHRELKEETGLSATTLTPLLELHTSNSVTDEWGIVFIATGLKAGEAKPEDSEVLQTRRILLDDLIDEVEAGKITDSLTVAATYKLAWLKATNRL